MTFIVLYTLSFIVLTLYVVGRIIEPNKPNKPLEPTGIIKSKRKTNVKKFNKWVEQHRQNSTFISIDKSFEI